MASRRPVLERTGPAQGPQASRPRRPPLADAWGAGLVVAPAIAICVLGYLRRFMSDDGLIYTRVVRQILAGNGPVFNATERAEASTSSVWPWVVALGSWLGGVSPERVAVFGGLVLTAVGLGVAVDATCRLYYRRERVHTVLVPAGVVVLVALPPVWDFATSGLETGLGTLWLGACWWLLVRTADGLSGRGAALAAAIFGLGPMIRPDFALFSGCFLVSLLVLLRPRRKRALLLLATAGALPFAYEVFRAGYYGILLPLPALAKEGMALYWSRGFRYVGDFLGPYWLWWPLVGVVLLFGFVGARWRESGRGVVVATPVLAGLLMLVYVVAVGGDFMHARMVLPPLMAVLLPVLVVPFTRATMALVAAIVIWALTGLTPMRPPFHGRPDVQHIVHVDRAVTKIANPITAEQWIRAFPRLREQVEAAVATGAPTVLYGSSNHFLHATARAGMGSRLVVHGGWLGTLGAVVPLEQTIADEWSLAYPLGAHFELGERAPFAGHEKPVSWVWMLADYADPASGAAGVDAAQLAAARRALGCGELRELQESVRAPMSVARFWRNLTGSLRRTMLRIPTDPFAAERRFCT